MQSSDFVHLHTHSHYSLLGALPSPKALVERVKEQGGSAVALTDSDALYGAIQFYQLCKEQGVNPIIGLDAHLAPHGRHQKRARVDKKAWRMVLLATSEVGYRNLLKLSSQGFLEGFYYTARIDDELLEQHHEGLIALSGGVGGEIPTLLYRGDRDKAQERARYYEGVFGKGNFYIELVHRPDSAEQVQTNSLLVELARELDMPLVATSNAFYLNTDDHEAWEALQCIQKGRTLEDYRRMSGIDLDLSLASPEEMMETFREVPDAVENTKVIAERCHIELELDVPYLPHVEVPDGKTDAQYLREICERGLEERYGEMKDEIRERFEYEFGVIEKMGFASYFLIVHDFVDYAKKQGILVGPGRGSAAGSIIAYALHVTDIDPLKYGLLFERFLNPDRVSMPDIDMDFADSRRGEVLDYVKNKYGAEHVAGIITFGTMMPRAAVRDAARVLGLDFKETDKIAKLIPPPVQGRHTPLTVAVKEHVELRNLYQSDSRARQVLDLATKIEGTPRHASQHACGVVISDKPLTDYAPIQESQHDDLDYVSQYSLSSVDAAGLVKMDFLGLSNLSIIEQALEIIDAVHGVTINIDTLPLDDKETFALLGRGETIGVFQLESDGMRRYLVELQPSEFEDIVAMCALYRPGPLSAGMVPQYINRKHGRETVSYDHPLMEDILKETYGVTIYQEQIMSISRSLAGFSGGQADTLRKAMGKKKRDVLAKMRTLFIEGCAKNGVNKTTANKIWADWEGFADYAFNKSHSACYGMIAYRTAYLKAHYPAEFMAAVMNSDAGNTDRMTVEVQECQRMGIEVLPPDVNESFVGFGVVGKERRIRWGLVAIKNVGEEVAKQIVQQRKEGGPYVDLADFMSRMNTRAFNKKALEALAMVGALDRFGERGALMANLPRLLRFHKQVQDDVNRQQSSLFDLAPDMEAARLTLAPSAPATRTERLAWERELLGIYVSEHPYQACAEQMKKHVVSYDRVGNMKDGAAAKVAGVVSAVRTILTKKGDTMAFVKLEDGTAELETVFFPRTYESHKSFLEEGKLMIISGKVSVREGQSNSVLVDSVVCFKEEELEEVVGMLEQGMWVSEDVHQAQLGVRENHQQLEDKEYVLIALENAPSPKTISGLRDLFQARAGKTPVQFAVDSGGRTKRIKTEFSIQVTNATIDALGDIIGSSNVQVVGNEVLS